LGIVSIHVHLSGLEVISSNLFFREETVFIPRHLYFAHYLKGNCFFTVRASGMNGAGLEGVREEEGGITFNIAGVSGRFVKLPAAAKRRCWYWGRIFPVRSHEGASPRSLPGKYLRILFGLEFSLEFSS
jgi:hypothetical protein